MTRPLFCMSVCHRQILTFSTIEGLGCGNPSLSGKLITSPYKKTQMNVLSASSLWTVQSPHHVDAFWWQLQTTPSSTPTPLPEVRRKSARGTARHHNGVVLSRTTDSTPCPPHLLSVFGVLYSYNTANAVVHGSFWSKKKQVNEAETPRNSLEIDGQKEKERERCFSLLQELCGVQINGYSARSWSSLCLLTTLPTATTLLYYVQQRLK